VEHINVELLNYMQISTTNVSAYELYMIQEKELIHASSLYDTGITKLLKEVI
jgi:hypothetical protein